MKSIMRGREKRRKRRVGLALGAVAVLVFAAGVWLLFFNGVAKLKAVYLPAEPTPTVTQASTPAPSESVLGVSTTEAAPTATVDPSDWRLILVNTQHSLPEGFKVTLEELKNGQSVDERCYADLQQMIDDCRAAGCKPVICSSYRSQEKQQQLFDNKVAKLVAQGLSDDEAHKQAATIVALPGTSEHQTGLALDIVDIDNQNLDDTQKNTPVQQWLVKNCWQYGFILRYPAEKTDITGITYESWHYRYVGKEAAKAIFDQNICLEEYLNQLG